MAFEMGSPSLAIPENCRLALICNAYRGDGIRAFIGLRERFHRDSDLRRPDLNRIMLDPTWLRKDLPNGRLRLSTHATVGSEQ